MIKIRPILAYGLAIALLGALFGFVLGPALAAGTDPYPESVLDPDLLEEPNGSGLGSESSFESFRKAQSVEPVDLSGEKLPAGAVLAAENEFLALHVDRSTGVVAVVDKETGRIWSTNPVDAEGVLVSGARIGSQVVIQYQDASGRTGTMDSRTDAAAHNQVDTESLEGGVRVGYLLYNPAVTLADVPQVLTAERFEALLSRVDEAGAKELKSRYSFITLKGYTDEEYLAAMREKYVRVEEYDLYALKPGISELILGRIRTILDAAGYTAEDLAQDNLFHGIEVQLAERPSFRLSLEYRLEGRSLRVDVPLDRMEHPDSVVPVRMNLLESFGAASRQETGYMLVPDGTGALIYLNNGKTGVNPYAAQVYGADPSIRAPIRTRSAEDVLVPAFGMKRGHTGFIAWIESGDALAEIQASVSGVTGDYNFVGASFRLTAADTVSLGSGYETDRLTVLESAPYRGRIAIRYLFGSGEAATYSGMAALLRDHLVAAGLLPGEADRRQDLPAVPLQVGLLGSVPKERLVLGVPVLSKEALTTFGQARDLVLDLAASGVSGYDLLFVGGFNGGLLSTTSARLRAETLLGGTRGLASLADTLRASGSRLVPSLPLQAVPRSGSGFASVRDGTRDLSRDIAILSAYNPMNHARSGERPPSWLLSPTRLPDFANSLADSLDDLSLDAVSLSDAGSLLLSDFDPDRAVNRQEARSLVLQALAILSESGSLDLSRGNLYSIPYARSLSSMPVSDSGFDLCDQSVPFLPLLIRGTVAFTGRPLNYAGDYRSQFLRSLEYGAGLSWLVFSEQAGLTKDSAYNQYFNGRYRDWKERMVRDVLDVQEAFGDLPAARMAGHDRLAESVYRTAYEDGTEVYVNYGSDAWSADGILVNPGGFAVRKGVGP